MNTETHKKLVKLSKSYKSLKHYFSQPDYRKSSLLNRAFLESCGKGDVDTMHFLTTCEDLPYRSEMYSDGIEGFSCACLFGQTDAIKYYLESDAEVDKKMLAISYGFYQALRNLCQRNHVEQLKYVLENFDVQIPEKFILCLNVQVNKDVLDYLLFETNYVVPATTYTILKDELKNKAFASLVEEHYNFVEKCNLKEHLENNLSESARILRKKI